MTKHLPIIFTILFIANFASAQTWQWGRRGGGSAGLNNQAEKVVDMATDKQGNVYILAQLDGATDAVIGTANGDTVPPLLPGGRDAVLISYNCSGKLRWFKVFGGNLDDEALGMGMDTLGHINVLVSGPSTVFKADADYTAANSKRKRFALIQYDTMGQFKWLKMATPDTVSLINSVNYGALNSAVMPNGDTYLFCQLGHGLISGSTTLAVTTPGMYMLKYDVNGVPKELVKLDMRFNGAAWNYANFNVTKNRKFLFTAIRNSANTTDSLIIGGQQVMHKVFLCCFSPTGNVLWRVENTDTTSGGILGRPYIDNNKGLVYVCGGGLWGTQRVDTLGGIPIINQGTKGFLPFIASLDTLGNYKYVKWGSCNVNIGCGLSGLTFRNDGRLVAYGDGAGVIWGSYYFYGVNGQGYQSFMPSFDAATGNILGMDSLRGAGAINANAITSDNNNNIYVGGQLSSNVIVGSQNLNSIGGLSDFFIAKYGYANCSGTVPLKFLNYDLRFANGSGQFPSGGGVRGGFVENIWQTANEINVSHFNIQRSTDGRDFATIGKISAQNKITNEYHFADHSKLSTVYYRIESVDKDGYKNYSETKTINLRPQTLNSLSIYPNPAENMVTIEVSGAKELMIIDYLGRNIKQFNNPTERQTLNTKQFTKGVYIVKAMMDNGGIKTEKLVIE